MKLLFYLLIPLCFCNSKVAPINNQSVNQTLLNASKLNGTYDVDSYKETAKDQLYKHLNGGSFAKLYFDGKGIGQTTSNMAGLKQTYNFEYSQDSNVLKFHYLPNGVTVKWLVTDIKGDYAYIIIKVLPAGTKFILVKRHEQ